MLPCVPALLELASRDREKDAAMRPQDERRRTGTGDGTRTGGREGGACARASGIFMCGTVTWVRIVDCGRDTGVGE